MKGLVKCSFDLEGIWKSQGLVFSFSHQNFEPALKTVFSWNTKKYVIVAAGFFVRR